MATSMRPMRGKVVLKRVEPEETSKGGIIIPSSAQEKPVEAYVVAVGKSAKDRTYTDSGVSVTAPLDQDVQVGDRVIIGKWVGTELKIDDVEHLIVNEDDVLAVVER